LFAPSNGLTEMKENSLGGNVGKGVVCEVSVVVPGAVLLDDEDFLKSKVDKKIKMIKKTTNPIPNMVYVLFIVFSTSL
jgi:hypothetical protein